MRLADIEAELTAIAAGFDPSDPLGSEAVAVLRRAARIKNLAAGIAIGPVRVSVLQDQADAAIWHIITA